MGTVSFTVVIPARFDSTRLPGKVLAEIASKPMIAHVVDRANESFASRVIVATDDQRIVNALSDCDCETVMTRKDHLSGSDRSAEVVNLMQMHDEEIIVNVQGDEPLIPGRLINQVAEALHCADMAVMSTAAHPINLDEDMNDPNVVKVALSQSGRALYFSRAAIPYAQNKQSLAGWHHIGIYAYRAGFLKKYAQLKPSLLEQAESLEQLRVLDNDHHIVVKTVDYETGFGVDTEGDLQRVREILAVQKHDE